MTNECIQQPFASSNLERWLIMLLFFLFPAIPVRAETEKTNHWAFQPARHVTPPQVKNDTWPRNPLDLFILARLEQEGMKPSPEADRRTLIRRLSFDLTGLPPTPQEVEHFVSDPDPQAYEKLVDRLLESPRYGERWARHWLDVVHFGETHGYDKDKLRPNAWPYRDYVIRSFNQDKPYSRFVQEQLAGDVLFPDEPNGIVATGFIAAGPWDFVGHVELPITKTDGLIARYNDRDDMVMTAMSTFQSLTVHCARCHDHKFDPISQREYYSLQAVFAGVDRADRPYDADHATTAKRRSLRHEKERLQSRQNELAAAVAKLTSPELEKLNQRLAELTNQLASAPMIQGKRGKTLGYHSKIEKNQDLTKWVQVDLGASMPLEQVLLVPAFEIYGTHNGPGFGFPARFRVDVSDDPEFKRFQTIADRTGTDFPHPGNLPFLAEASGRKGRFVRVTATKLWKRTGDWIFALGELLVLSKGTNAAAGKPVASLDSIEAPPSWSKANLVNGESVLSMSATNSHVTPLVFWLLKSRGLQQEINQLAAKREQLVERLMPPPLRAERTFNEKRLAEVNKELADLPPPQWVYAAAADFKSEGSFIPAKGVRPVHYLARGDVKRPKEEMVPAALSAVPGPPFKLDHPDNEGARRAALAHWITDPSNFLTRRSIVNRVWQYHFGKGIVDSPNDFGHMGAVPSHPELLDWLASWFLEHRESLKQLHRLILTSATYRQSSADNPEFALKDGDNRWLWRMNRTKLDAECIRDALLSVSGRLDLKMGGPSVRQFFFKDDHSPIYDYTRFDVNSPEANRRSIYRHLVRSVTDPFMDCLDCADPSLLVAKRNSTLTALQALATLNNPFVLQQAEHLAERLQQMSKDAQQQIELACQMAFSRPATEKEKTLLIPYAQKHGLANACRLLFNSNEFIFVE